VFFGLMMAFLLIIWIYIANITTKIWSRACFWRIFFNFIGYGLSIGVVVALTILAIYNNTSLRRHLFIYAALCFMLTGNTKFLILISTPLLLIWIFLKLIPLIWRKTYLLFTIIRGKLLAYRSNVWNLYLQIIKNWDHSELIKLVVLKSIKFVWWLFLLKLVYFLYINSEILLCIIILWSLFFGTVLIVSLIINDIANIAFIVYKIMFCDFFQEILYYRKNVVLYKKEIMYKLSDLWFTSENILSETPFCYIDATITSLPIIVNIIFFNVGTSFENSSAPFSEFFIYFLTSWSFDSELFIELLLYLGLNVLSIGLYLLYFNQNWLITWWLDLTNQFEKIIIDHITKITRSFIDWQNTQKRLKLEKSFFYPPQPPFFTRGMVVLLIALVIGTIILQILHEQSLMADTVIRIYV
jgi:hypothetical protein